MGSLFERLNAPGEAALDAIHAEKFGYEPMVAVPNDEATPDPDRDAIDALNAIFFAPGEQMILSSRTAVSIEQPTMHVLATAFAKPPRKADVFTRTRNGILYEVRSVRPDDAGIRLIIELAEIAPPDE